MIRGAKHLGLWSICPRRLGMFISTMITTAPANGEQSSSEGCAGGSNPLFALDVTDPPSINAADISEIELSRSFVGVLNHQKSTET